MSKSITGDPDYCKEAVAQKVWYEYSMFKFLGGILKGRVMETSTFAPGDVIHLGTGTEPDDEDLRTTYAFLESYLLHARVLHDFFYKDQSRDDIVAEHFVDQWVSLRPARDPYLGDEERKKRLDKGLAHLTLKRLEYDVQDKKWNIEAVEAAIETPMKRFLELLPEERKPWFTFRHPAKEAWEG
jgi:hypothetical protein